MKHQAPVKDLEEICYTDNQASIRWEEEGEEFSWNNQLYDVARIVSRNGKTWLLCLEDGKEETLLRQMCAASQHDEKKSSHHGMAKIADDFTLPGSILLASDGIIVPRMYSSYMTQLLQPAMTVTVPPPRC
ncbi:MAG TPA: hypothetical protein VLD19_09780 [Chitinophagaceae bacterium]|nr:hypothetical protein [Chitinophagaceae bacterium]